MAAQTLAGCEMSPDKNVEAVRDKLLQRSIVGLKKYGVTTERDDIDLAGWLEHLQLELLDAVIYIEAAKGKINGSP
jgi:hypothetical protein